MTSSATQQYEFPSALDSLAKVENIIETLKTDFDISEEVYGNILVSISEGINNAIKHGNNFEDSKKVQFSFDVTDKSYIFTVADEGTGFDHTSVPDPTHPDNLEKIDGRGIFIMTNLCDEIDFEDNGRKIILTFNK